MLNYTEMRKTIKHKKCFITIAGIGWIFSVDKKACFNYINPVILSQFYYHANNQSHPLADLEIEKTKKVQSNCPFDEIDDDCVRATQIKAIRYMGTQLAPCYDGKFRHCKRFKITLKIDGTNPKELVFMSDISLLRKYGLAVWGVIRSKYNQS